VVLRDALLQLILESPILLLLLLMMMMMMMLRGKDETSDKESTTGVFKTGVQS
jgi:hypothetical protein